jgi:hypothetical protein
MAIDICRVNYQKSCMEVGKMKIMDHHYHNKHHQSRSEKTVHRTKRKRARRWDAILVGVVFSVAFLLLLTKVSQITPCEPISYFHIDTKTCSHIGNANTIEWQISSQHGLGFDIIFQYWLLTLESYEELMDHAQGFLRNVGLK